MNEQKYFRDFFDEKEIDRDDYFTVETDQNTHMIEYGVVIDTIKQTSGVEAEKIARTLMEIDFKNGDVRHYLRHLGQALAHHADMVQR